jgi:hypothetical protein
MGKQEDVDACNDDDDNSNEEQQQQLFHGSGILLHHYDHQDSCFPSWRVSCSSIVFSPDMASGTASEVKGAVFLRGVQAYRFQATAATISASSQPHSSVLQITGDLEVSDDAMAATMHCKNLTWDTMSRVLKLGGPVVAAHLQSNATKSAPELTPHMSSKNKSMQNEEDRSATSKGESVSTSQQLSRDCSDHLAATTDSSICHAHVRMPAAYFNSLHRSSGINFKEWVAINLSQKGSALFVKVFKQLLSGLGGMMKNLPQKSCKHEEEDAPAVVFPKERAVLQPQQDLSLVEVIITAEKGVVIDMEGGIVSSPGVLSIACPARQTQVHSGAGDMLIRNGVFLALHGGVVARIQAFNLKAQKISCCWFDDNQQGPPQSSQMITGPEMHQPEGRAVTRDPKKSAGSNGIAVDQFNRDRSILSQAFNAKVSKIHRQRPHIKAHLMLSSMSRIESYTCCASHKKHNSHGSSRFVLRKSNVGGNLTGILQVVYQQVVSALHVSFRTSQISNFVGVDFNVSQWFSDNSEFLGLRKMNEFNSISSVQEELDAFHKIGRGAMLVAQGDVRIWWQ